MVAVALPGGGLSVCYRVVQDRMFLPLYYTVDACVPHVAEFDFHPRVPQEGVGTQDREHTT